MSETIKSVVTVVPEDKKKKWPSFLEETTDESDVSSSSDETESTDSSDDESSKSDTKSEAKSESNDDSKKESKDDTESSSLSVSDSEEEEEDEVDIAKRTLAKSYFRNGKVVCPNFPFSPNRVFVWNLTHQVSRDHVFEIFTAFGKIVGLFMPRFNEQLPDEFRFAVVQYSALEECKLAAKFMNDATVDDINIQVSTTKPAFILGIDFSASIKMQTKPERHRPRPKQRSTTHRYGYGMSYKTNTQRSRQNRYRRNFRRNKRQRTTARAANRRSGYRRRRRI